MEGVSGHEDLGASQPSSTLKTTRVPIILIATAIAEGNERVPPSGQGDAIEFKPVPTMDVYASF
jgi:hypothetical protein